MSEFSCFSAVFAKFKFLINVFFFFPEEEVNKNFQYDKAFLIRTWRFVCR